MAEADESRIVGNAGMRLERIGEYDAALAVDLERLAGAVERQRELLAAVGIGREAGDQRLDIGKQRIASGIECRPIECRITIEPVEAVAPQHRAKRCRHRYAPFGVQPQHVMGHKAIHLALCHAGGPLRKALAS